MSDLNLAQLAEEHPLAHPAVAAVRLFEYSHAPGDHLLDLYTAVWRAVDADYPHAPRHIARLLPRGHGKTEGASVVTPTWAVLRNPECRVAVISKTKGLAAERTEKVVEMVERYGPQFGVEVADVGRTQITTAVNDHKEPTVSPYGLESQLTGKHFDIIVYDDIADWDNQRTETQRRNVRNYFRDYVDNLGSNDSVLPHGPVQVVIGTRKHPQDIYETDVLDAPQWDVGVYQAIHERDWPIVETRNWQIRGSDGDLYDTVGDLPTDVQLAEVIPNRDIEVLWPELQPPEALLTDIVGGDHSTAVWKRENQQDPQALAGEVFKSEWLTYVDELPTDDDGDRCPLRWVAGLDIGLVEDPQKAAEGDTDYTALAIVGVDTTTDRAYLDTLVRDRGLSTKGIVDWVVDQADGYDLDILLVEQNAGRGPGQRLRDSTPVPARNVSSTGDKESRIHSLSADFESGRLVIHGDSSAATWASFEADEWLQFPTAAHDDRLDAIEIAMRAVEFGSVPTATATVGAATPSTAVERDRQEFVDGPLGEAVEQFRLRRQEGFRR